MNNNNNYVRKPNDNGVQPNVLRQQTAARPVQTQNTSVNARTQMNTSARNARTQTGNTAQSAAYRYPQNNQSAGPNNTGYVRPAAGAQSADLRRVPNNGTVQQRAVNNMPNSTPNTAGRINTAAVNRTYTSVDVKRPQTQSVPRPVSRTTVNTPVTGNMNRTSPTGINNSAVSRTGIQNVSGQKNAQSELSPPRRLTPDRASATSPEMIVRDGKTYVKKKKSGKKAFGRSDDLDKHGQTRSSTEDAVNNTLGSVFKAVAYIGFVLVVSVVLSIFGISVGNDVFAFSKDERNVTVVIPEYASIIEISDILKDTGIIKYPIIFRLYAGLSSMDEREYEAGSYDVSTTMSYDALMNTFIKPIPERTQISVTIPEGYTVDQIISLFVDEYGIGTRESFYEALETYEWDYWFVKEIEENRDTRRKYKLEGYLFPDTYYYYSDTNPETVIWKMLENFNDKFTEDMRERCSALGYTADQMITLASMIQMEGHFPSEYTEISSVFHNRLNNPYNETQGRLESDPTIMYAIGEHRTNLTYEEKNMDSPYNTYLEKGLPPSAISNPSLYAINCALYPNETSYLYFYALGNGYHVFATTYQEHVKNINEANLEQQ